MASGKIFRASIFIAALIVGLLRESVALGKESWQPLHDVEGIREFQFQNGLKVLLFPDQSKATITVNITYFVGSRHEGYGEAGMAHLLEHMLFRGTKVRGNIMKLLEEKGGNFNGTTSFDRTNYFETLPASAENLEFALALEADRMLNSRIAAEDLAKEFSVVRNEFEMGENSPESALSDQMLGVAYQWHGYGRSTIGNRSDIEKVPADRLRDFYQKYYQPDNALLVVAGQFEEQKAQQLIEKYFAALPKPTRALGTTYTIEPVQEGERTLTLRRAGEQAVVGLLYHTVAGAHPEAPGIEALATVLTEQPHGLLYRELVKKGLASEVEGSVWNLAEPGVLAFFAKVGPGQDPEKLARRMTDLVEHLKPEQLNPLDLARYQQHFARNFTLSWADSSWTAVELSEWAAMGDWRLLFAHRDAVQNLNMDQLLRARRYLQASNRTLGFFLPTDKPQRAPETTPLDLTASLRQYESNRPVQAGERFEATWPNIQNRLQTFTLSNGMKVAILPKQGRGEPVNILLNISLRHDPSLKTWKQALHVLPDLMLRGAGKLDHGAFDDALALHKAHIEVHSDWNLQDPGRVRFSAVTVGEHSSALLDLLIDVLRSPRLAPEEWRILKSEVVAAAKEESQDPGSLAWREFMRSEAPYADDDPRSIPSLQKELEQWENMPLDSLKKAHAALLQYGKVQLVIIGAVDPQLIKAQLERRLADWKPKPETQVLRYAHFRTQGGQTVLNTPDKKGAQIFAGLPLALSDEDPDYPALKMGALIWGGTMGSRLVQRLRHQDGLSYGAGGGFNPGIQSPFGNFSSFAICAPQNVARAVKGLQEELARLLRDGITEPELQEARHSYEAQRKNALADDSNLLDLILKNLEIERSLDFEAGLDQKLASVNAQEIHRALNKWLKPEQLLIIEALDQSAAGLTP